MTPKLFVRFSSAAYPPFPQSLQVIARSLVSSKLHVLTFEKSSINSCSFSNNLLILIQCKLGMSNFLFQPPPHTLFYTNCRGEKKKKKGNTVLGHKNIWIHSTSSGQHGVYRFSWLSWYRTFWLRGRSDLNFMLFADNRAMMEDSNNSWPCWVFCFRRNIT